MSDAYVVRLLHAVVIERSEYGMTESHDDLKPYTYICIDLYLQSCNRMVGGRSTRALLQLICHMYEYSHTWYLYSNGEYSYVQGHRAFDFFVNTPTVEVPSLYYHRK
jgi:hypothetical protein